MFWFSCVLADHILNKTQILEMQNMCSGNLKLRQNGQQKHTTCLTTLLQNESNSDVARFISKLPCNKPGITRNALWVNLG